MATPLKCFSRRLSPQIFFTQTRSGHKFRTKNPRQKPLERKVFEAVTRPILPETTSYLRKSCRDPYTKQVEEENPYEQFLIRQLKKLVDGSQLIIICHKLPCSNLRLKSIGIDFKVKGLKLSILNRTHMKTIIEDTDKANLSYLLTGYNVMITSPDLQIKEAWAVMRKIPELVPIGGYCHDRLVTKDQLQELSKLPTIEQLRGELVSCLNLLGSRTSALLSSHQQTLSTNLQQYHKQKSEDS